VAADAAGLVISTVSPAKLGVIPAQAGVTVFGLSLPSLPESSAMTTEFTGALRERVNIEQRLGGRDAIAGATGDYRFDGCAWAAVLPLNDAAVVEADALSARPRWQVTMRKREGISLATRLWWRGRYLVVRGVACDLRVPGRMILTTEEVI
jgi:head-tail adaptor